MQMTIQNQTEFLSLIQNTMEDPDFVRDYLWSGSFREFIKKVEEGKWFMVTVKSNNSHYCENQIGNIVETKFIGKDRYNSSIRTGERYNGIVYRKEEVREVE